MHRLILASQSPRRRFLLEQAGFEMTIAPVKVSEILDKSLNLPEALQALAKTKAQAFVDTHQHLKQQNILVLGADTVVLFRGEVLGKPDSPNDAIKTLVRLSGQAHKVLTAFALIDLSSDQTITRCESTDVQFKTLTQTQIKSYVATGEPLDKAGSYGIQGLAKEFIKEISGSWSNVMGLPMELFEYTLNEVGWHVKKKSTAN